MKFVTMSILLISSLLLVNSAQARNESIKLSIKDAMESKSAKAKLGNDIKFIFGSKNKPKVKTSFGEYKSNKKTNAFNKSDKEACNWAFLSAMLSFQDRARKLGANAVINIKSYYYKNEISSSEIFECGAGNVIAGVTFTGEVVKLK